MANIDDLITKLAQDAPRVKAAPHPVLLSLEWVTIAAAYIAVALLFSGLRPDILLKFHEPLFVAEIFALFGIIVTTSLSAALLSYPDLHQMRRIVYVPSLAVAFFVATLFFAFNADVPPAPLPMHSFECPLMITLLGLLPAIGVFYVMRKYASTHQYWAGSVALLFAFSVGAIWLRLHEPNDSIMHVIECHYLPMIAVGLLGMWLGKTILKW